MSQRDDFVSIMLAQVGVLQYEFGCRCEWTCGQTDCSGLISGAAQRVGVDVGYGCPNSSALARLCHNAPRPQWMNDRFGADWWTGSYSAGTGISKDQARATKGAIGFHGLDQGQNGDGPTGHVKASLGDGRSVEAMSHAMDLRVWTFLDDKTTYTALLPNMSGFDQQPAPNPDPSSASEAKAMGFVSIPVPGAHVQTAGPQKGAMPLIAAMSFDGGITWSIACFNGASINGQKLFSLGKLNKPIEDASVVFIPDVDDKVHKPPHIVPTRQVIFSAGDGGTFGPYKPDVHYTA